MARGQGSRQRSCLGRERHVLRSPLQTLWLVVCEHWEPRLEVQGDKGFLLAPPKASTAISPAPVTEHPRPRSTAPALLSLGRNVFRESVRCVRLCLAPTCPREAAPCFPSRARQASPRLGLPKSGCTALIFQLQELCWKPLFEPGVEWVTSGGDISSLPDPTGHLRWVSLQDEAGTTPWGHPKN